MFNGIYCQGWNDYLVILYTISVNVFPFSTLLICKYISDDHRSKWRGTSGSCAPVSIGSAGDKLYLRILHLSSQRICDMTPRIQFGNQNSRLDLWDNDCSDLFWTNEQPHKPHVNSGSFNAESCGIIHSSFIHQLSPSVLEQILIHNIKLSDFKYILFSQMSHSSQAH